MVRNDGLWAYLAEAEGRYSADARMIGRSWSSGGYHTQVPDGVWVHPTRDNLDYALALLQAGEAARAARAADVIGKVLTLQETDPTARTYGIWPWLLEEPLDQMAPPDWNWADFCGARLAQMLIDHADQLPADLIAAMRASLGHAAWAIFRRNVGPGYTNIAVMGGCVTVAAGEILGEPRLVDYGRQRLGKLVAHTAHHGGFNEYNSPTYTMVVVHECERALQLLADGRARAHATALWETAWRTIAEHFHPGTGRWAGPHSRAYRDLLDETTAQALLIGAGLAEDDGRLLQLIEPLPCPAELAPRFAALPQAEVEIVRPFIRSADPWASRTGTTWLTDAACLGTVDYAGFWTQRRPLIGYWQVAEGAPAVLRMRFLHDGQDFASACGQHAQARNRVLSAVGLLTNRGDWHHHLDRPEDGVFRAADFRVRYELAAAGATVRQVAADRFELAAGDTRAVVHAAPSAFDYRPVVWEVGQAAGRATVDGLCYHGGERAFDLAAVSRVQVGAALEVLAPGEVATPSSPVWRDEDGARAELVWPDAALALSVPLRAHPSG